FRTATRVLNEGGAKNESSILGVAIPEQALKQHLDLFAEGAPAPHSLELSGLAAFSAFMFNRGKQTANQSICLIETGHSHTYVAFFHKNRLQVLNRFDIGGEVLQKKVEDALGVDEEMARTILSDGSVDVSAPVRSALASFVKQLSIYREYVERQNKSPLSGVYLSGDEAASPHWQNAIQEVLSLVPVVWNPFDKLDVPEGVYPENLKGQESRFSAAVGAALGGMEAK
ncbi:MAG TPA: pilus assembly protein PilM, partial [Tichowtungia sp.]|nr:pilus assembly protein PilM [Tichowtungia sp.]